MNPKYVLVYRHDQNALHTETVEDMLKANWEIFKRGIACSWYVLGFADTEEEIEQLREIAKAKNPNRNPT